MTNVEIKPAMQTVTACYRYGFRSSPMNALNEL